MRIIQMRVELEPGSGEAAEEEREDLQVAALRHHALAAAAVHCYSVRYSYQPVVVVVPLQLYALGNNGR